MVKNIIIFSDGTGQVGGVKPDQRLSNIYKMYRAMRPWPDSPINPKDQICFYDAGLGTKEDGKALSFSGVRRFLASALGSGIDDNVIDCYEYILANYEPGDRVLLFGFSRGAYTVRSVANVMNLCGIPTQMSDGAPIPKSGNGLRKIASDAVLYVYNHGAGKPRGQEPYFSQREELGKRFRKKYKSIVPDSDEDVQGNVQPDFIGVFDTVAALSNAKVIRMVNIGLFINALLIIGAFSAGWHWLLISALCILELSFGMIMVKQWFENWKYFSPNPDRTLSYKRPKDWRLIIKNGHRAVWNSLDYDNWLDSGVGFARHALAIDERRKNFSRVKWGARGEVKKNKSKHPAWLKQIWFAGCHSDIGGSYPESESRLSDIALGWMIDELLECIPDVKINDSLLNRFPDPLGLQHEEKMMLDWWFISIPWPSKEREIKNDAPLHPSVLERMNAKGVPIVDKVRPYRPENLKNHL